MREYYVYILECSDNSYYIGLTNNYERRLEEHRLGIHRTCYTYSKRPVMLVYVGRFHDIREAITFEKQIKRWSRSKKKALIERNYEALIVLAKNHQKADDSYDSVHGSTSSP